MGGQNAVGRQGGVPQWSTSGSGVRMRLKYFIAALAVLVLSSGCAKLPGVTKVGGDGAKGKDGAVVATDDGVGLYYALPLTVVKVETSLSIAYDVDKYKGKIKIAPDTIKRLSVTSITTTSVPDPAHVYKASLKSESFSDMSYMIQRTETGLPLAVGAGAVNRSGDVVAQMIRSAATIGAGWITGGIAAVPDVEASGPALERRKATAADFVYDPMATADSERSSDLKLFLRTIRGAECQDLEDFKKKAITAKKDMLVGELGKQISGDVIKARLEGIDAYIAATEDKCDGKNGNAVKFVFYANPVSGSLGEDYHVPVAYIGPKSGYAKILASPYDLVEDAAREKVNGLRKDSKEYRAILEDLYQKLLNSEDDKWKEQRSRLVFLDIKPDQSLGKTLCSYVGDGPRGEQGLYYREPGMAKVSISYQGKVVGSASVPLAQYGCVVALPQKFKSKESSFDVMFFQNTGAIKSFAVNTTGHTAKDTKAYYESMADIMNANIKLQQQQEAAEKAAKEAAKSASTTAATPATP
jgi:hypothetical protein